MLGPVGTHSGVPKRIGLRASTVALNLMRDRKAVELSSDKSWYHRATNTMVAGFEPV